jgi:hypothetical protein
MAIETIMVGSPQSVYLLKPNAIRFLSAMPAIVGRRPD